MFYAASMCKWVGPPRIVIDPLKNAKASEVAIANGTLTLADACAEDGNDWEEVVAQRKREKEAMIEAGLIVDPADIETDPADPSTNPDDEGLPPGQVSQNEM
jgi:capsid protein